MGLYEETVTGPNGAFRLSVCPEPGTLRVFPPDGLLVRGGNEVRLEVGSDDVHVPRIHLEPLPEIVGTVFAPGGSPEPNTLISSLDLDPPVWLIADPEGGFRIQLGRAPTGKARFRAEQALRFLRSDFEVDLHAPAAQEVSLAPFEPDLAAREGQGLTRGLADLVGAPAPELHCDAWFGLARELESHPPPPSLEDLRGNVIVLTFWSGVDASGTGRFRIEELRALSDLFRFSGTDDVVILGVHDSMAAPEEVGQYVEDYRINFPVGKDVGSDGTFERYRIRSIPRTVLIDRAGVLRHFDVGGRLLELIKGLRREPRSAP
jgi:hypothetical protein